jgi:hypothetical protein
VDFQDPWGNHHSQQRIPIKLNFDGVVSKVQLELVQLQAIILHFPSVGHTLSISKLFVATSSHANSPSMPPTFSTTIYSSISMVHTT